jgi:single-strand DNA-binding protein
MASINTVAISGNLVADCTKGKAGETPVVNFVLAVNDRRKNSQTGEWEDYVNFIECALFGPRAKALADALEKGVKVYVQGKLRQSRWEKDGQNRSKVSVTVDEIVIGYTRPAEAQDEPADDIPW